MLSLRYSSGRKPKRNFSSFSAPSASFARSLTPSQPPGLAAIAADRVYSSELTDGGKRNRTSSGDELKLRRAQSEETRCAQTRERSPTSTAEAGREPHAEGEKQARKKNKKRRERGVAAADQAPSSSAKRASEKPQVLSRSSADEGRRKKKKKKQPGAGVTRPQGSTDAGEQLAAASNFVPAPHVSLSRAAGASAEHHVAAAGMSKQARRRQRKRDAQDREVNRGQTEALAAGGFEADCADSCASSRGDDLARSKKKRHRQKAAKQEDGAQEEPKKQKRSDPSNRRSDATAVERETRGGGSLLERHREALQTQKNTLLQKLQGSRFRSLNQCLYTSTGQQALAAFTKDPSLFHAYHEGYRVQVAQWPSNPLDYIKTWVRTLPPSWRIADLGCGEAELSRVFPERNILSFDLVAARPEVIACNVAHLPLEAATLHAAVFCLSLMGRDWPSFVQEAHRVLRPGGILKIAEVLSRVQDVSAFIRGVEGLGFLLAAPTENIKSFFILLEFRKGGPGQERRKGGGDSAGAKKATQREEAKGRGVKGQKHPNEGKRGADSREVQGKKNETGAAAAKLEASLLRPCIYKRR
ncbi:methyltransferase domain-containing protein [Besnoitia besnoiti]|uniref:Ribosomal RNA-processing protein 8 n=1 Tax=Besnoitia besnoiti TaxID=94643 RepID=A0A2A9MGZ6_BESBE|nr:methyltransferase domain-containing protein [Besnoitia besnoiti]PFH34867.1 methyltransferase domain-containing protein [Besnoitia besnoiti]